jgi:hypothetical protein
MLIVLAEIWIAPAGRLSRIPSLPNTTTSTALSFATIVKTASARQASATVAAVWAPSLTRAFAFSRVRL